MPCASRLLSIAALLVLLPVTAARAAEVRIVSSDARGVTLRLDIGDYSLDPEGDDGRVLPVVAGLDRFGTTGRPRLPFGRALLVVPPGAQAVARVLTSGTEDVLEKTRVAIGGRQGASWDDRLGAVPTLEPADGIRDGIWPPEMVSMGEPTMMRDRRIVPIELHPFRYDEAAARLTITRSITVRVDFTGGESRSGLPLGFAPESQDRHFAGVFANQILNWDQGRTWRGQRRAMREDGIGLLRTGTTGSLPASGLASAAFDENAPEVRVRVDTTGLYSIPFDSLALYRYPLNVPIGEVSVHRHEFVEGAAVPYVTYELPIEVDDANHDLKFDSGDRILVWVWEWAKRSRASNALRVWGDGEVIYVTQKPGGAGLAFPHRTGSLGRNDLTPLASYPQTQRFRHQVQYVAFPEDTTAEQFLWTNFVLFSSPDAFPYEVNNIDGAMPETVTVNMQGTGNTSHVTWASTTNGANQTFPVVTAASWSGLHLESRTGILPPGAITEGATNTLKIWGQTNSGSGNVLTFAGLHSFDVKYWRRYAPIQGYLACNSGTEVSAFEVRAGPFTSAADLRVWDVSDSLNPVRLDNTVIENVGPDVYVHFQDTVVSGVQRDYIVCDVPRSPAPGAMAAVTRYRIFDHTAGDYLAVAPEGYLGSIQPLVDLHNRQGLRVVVAPLEGLNDEFNGGRRSSYSIRRFVQYAYSRWDAQFVLLVGDGSEDPQHFAQFPSPDLVPVQKVFGPVASLTGPGGDYAKEIVPSDAWFGLKLSTGPFANLPVPEIAIGRLPVSSVPQLDGVVAKIVKYDDLSGDQSWRRNLLLMADDMYSGVSTFDGSGTDNTYCRHTLEANFLKIDQTVNSLIRNNAGLAQTNIELFNLSYYLPNLPADITVSTDTCRNNRATFQSRGRLIVSPALLSRLNSGEMWWSYQGHANQWVISHEDVYLNSGSNDDKDRLANDGRPFLFTGFSCHPNSFARVDGASADLGPAFGEELVTLPRGAIASFASVGFEAIPVDFTSQLHTYVADAMFVHPPHDEVLGDRGARGVLGEVLNEAMFNNYFGRIGNQAEQYVGISYVLLGDPATRLSLGTPQAVVTANSLPVVDGQDIRLHTVGDTLRIDADLVSNVRLDSLALTQVGPAGNQVLWRAPDPPPAGLTVTPAFPDTQASSALGGRRFHLTYKAQLLANTYRYQFHTLDRYQQASNFDAVFSFRTILQVNGQAILDGDFISPTAALTVLVRSPKPLDPPNELALTVNGAVQPFTFSAAPGDASGREWVVAWDHAPYAAGTNDVKLVAQGGAVAVMTFRVAAIGAAVELRNVMAFPNPFDDDYLRALAPGYDVATLFSFDLISAAPADVTLRVYTISGRLIYQRTEHGLDARYHQLPWNGSDAEGFPLANGVYIYRLLASNGTGTTMQEGRIVKLRRPRRTVSPSSTP